MKRSFKALLGAFALALAGTAAADVTFYEHDNFGGRQFSAHDGIDDFRRIGFNDRASSVVVTGRPWEVCDDVGFRGHCFVLRPGNYPSLSAMNLGDRISSAREVDRHAHIDDRRWAPPPLPGQVTFYENDDFQGRAFSAQGDVPDFRRFGFNDRASSVVVVGERWEACEDDDYNGRCVFLRPGNYPSLRAMGLNDRISSVRMVPPGMRVDEGGWAPPPPPAYDARRRPHEELFQAQVVASHAVFGTPTQRCWVDQQQVRVNRNQVGGAVLGGIVGGILGHQIGHDNGATIAGAVGGAVVGGAIGGNAGGTRTEDVRRCETVPNAGPPQYWDTVYVFRGVEHHIQTTGPAGPTITVNERGEPRN